MASNEALFAYYDAFWLNTALGGVWEVLDQTGGVGPYISDMYADVVNAELAKVIGTQRTALQGRARAAGAQPHLPARASLQSALQQHPRARSSDRDGSSKGNTTLAAQPKGFLAKLIDLVRVCQSALTKGMKVCRARVCRALRGRAKQSAAADRRRLP
jgi:hypothetical protein